MPRLAKEIIERLGPDGLRRALGDLLDQARLVDLANSCGIKYRGMRTKSQKRERLLKDVAAKAAKQDDVGTAVVRALEKEATTASREWNGLAADEKARRLCDEEFLRANGNVGLYLYLLATDEGAEMDGLGTRLARQLLLRVSPNGAEPEDAAGKSSREEARLRRQVQQNDRKLRHLEGQLARSRESEKTSKQDLIQRKGELAESRMLVERLRNDLALAQQAAQLLSRTAAATEPPAAVGELTKSIKQLVTENKKLLRTLKTKADDKADSGAAALRSLQESLKQWNKVSEEKTVLRERQAETLSRKLDALRAEVRARPAVDPAKPAKRARPRGSAQRIGVFIDVQNMYYSARRLKGKLDFDALMEAAVQQRRLIQATAYVVESKETDQTQFFEVLEKRAIEVRRKTVQVRADGSRKGDWDMELALDILDAASKLDVVVLVSGDGDFTSLVKRVKTIGPRVEVIAYPRATAKSLLQAADHFRPLDRKFMIYKRPPRPETAPPPADDPPKKAS